MQRTYQRQSHDQSGYPHALGRNRRRGDRAGHEAYPIANHRPLRVSELDHAFERGCTRRKQRNAVVFHPGVRGEVGLGPGSNDDDTVQ